MQELIKNVYAVDLGILIEDNLIISDIHIGYEESLNKKGIMIPRFGFKEIIQKLDKMFDRIRIKLDKIVLNGDLKHEFGKISETEWRHTLRLIDYLAKKCNEIVLIKGNHDPVLDPIAKKREIKLVDSLQINDCLIIHGDVMHALPKVKTLIMGHEHPAVSLQDGPRIEKYKCFLVGKWKEYNLIVQPSFTPITEGSDVNKEKMMSPYLQHDLKNFKVFVVGDKVYDFGYLKKILENESS